MLAGQCFVSTGLLFFSSPYDLFRIRRSLADCVRFASSLSPWICMDILTLRKYYLLCWPVGVLHPQRHYYCWLWNFLLCLFSILVWFILFWRPLRSLFLKIHKSTVFYYKQWRSWEGLHLPTFFENEEPFSTGVFFNRANVSQFTYYQLRN